MKQVMKNAIYAFVLLLGVVLLVGCTPKEAPKLEVGVDSQLEILYNDSLNLEATIVSEEKGLVIKYTSDNPEVVSVDNSGNIKGLEIGEAKITVRIDGQDIKVVVKVTVKAKELTITGDNEVYAGSTIALSATDEKGGNDLIWDSENNTIATVDSNGNVTGKKVGKVNIMAVSGITGEIIMKEINVLEPNPTTIEVSRRNEGKVLLLDEVKLNYTVLPNASSQEVKWASSDETIATVDDKGLVTTHRSGEVEITATSVKNINVVGRYTLIVEVDPIALLTRFNVENPIHKLAKSNLIPTMDDYIYGSVNLFWSADMNLSQEIIPIDTQLDNEDGSKLPNIYQGKVATQEIIKATDLKSVRPGVLKPEIKYITYHDTGNYSVGTGARNHANYMVGQWNRTVNYSYGKPYGYRSWHYTVDDKEIIQHLPDNEISFQGDVYDSYVYAIGIETAISKGSNFFTTWHRTAKLISTLMVKYNLPLESIEQHHEWSGKDCPQVLRASGLWQTALDMVLAEYLVLQELQGYKIEFTSNSPDYVTNEGRIIKLDSSPRLFSYQVRITNNNGYDQTKVLYSTLPAKLG